MQKIHHDSDTLTEQEPAGYSDSIRVSFNDLGVAAKKFESDLNLYVSSESGKPLDKALISIDSVSFTAVSDQAGKVCIKALNAGRYSLDIICCGFIAKSIIIYIDESGSQEICAQLASNIG